MSEYMFAKQQKRDELRRLQMIEEALDPLTIARLQQIGIRAGWKCLELGAGAGSIMKTDALCVAWEGSGGARAAKLNGLPFLEVRVITDAADDSASVDFDKNLKRTIPNIALLLAPWLRDDDA